MMIPILLSTISAHSTPSNVQKLQRLPKVVASELLAYPMEGRQLGIRGIVLLDLTTDGLKPASVQVISGPPVLRPSAIRFVQSWVFKKHTPIKFQVEIEYELIDPASPLDEDPGDSPVLETLTLHLPTKAKVQSVIIPNGCAGVEVVNTTVVPKRNTQ